MPWHTLGSDPLYPDPTTLEGPAHLTAEEGKTKWATYTLNAVDGFIPRRGELTVACTHPDINGREITVGQLKAGRIRISIAVPARIDLGTYQVQVLLKDWARSSGGIGPTLSWNTELPTKEAVPFSREKHWPSAILDSLPPAEIGGV